MTRFYDSAAIPFHIIFVLDKGVSQLMFISVFVVMDPPVPSHLPFICKESMSPRLFQLWLIFDDARNIILREIHHLNFVYSSFVWTLREKIYRCPVSIDKDFTNILTSILSFLWRLAHRLCFRLPNIWSKISIRDVFRQEFSNHLSPSVRNSTSSTFFRSNSHIKFKQSLRLEAFSTLCSFIRCGLSGNFHSDF